MRQKVLEKTSLIQRHWRDIVLGTIAILVIGSFVGIAYGISQNNKLASQTKLLAQENKELAQQQIDHVNCIIKDLSVPRPAGANQKIIELLGKDCNIKFTQ